MFLSICSSQSYDYYLEDINTSSFTYGERISPEYFQGQVTLHYFGHQNWGTCTARVGNLDDLYQDLLDEGIDNVKIIAIGRTQYNAYNNDWIEGNSIPIIIDPSPYALWASWSASQRDLYFLDANGNYVEDFNITTWDDNKIYNSIINIISGCTDFEDANYDPDATIDDGSCALAIETPIFPDQNGITSTYPNPFNPIATINYVLPENTDVILDVYDINGKQITSLVNAFQVAGYYNIRWNASSFPSGVYLINMESSNFKKVQKVVLIKWFSHHIKI